MDDLEREIAEIVCDRCDEIAEIYTDKERVRAICKDIANDIATLLPQWIRVEDKVPVAKGRHFGVEVLAYRPRKSKKLEIQMITWWDGDEIEYTHWMPLPQPPKD